MQDKRNQKNRFQFFRFVFGSWPKLQKYVDGQIEDWRWGSNDLERLCAYMRRIWEGYIEICLTFYWSIVLLLYFGFFG